jgi:hypothetical protein
MPDVRPSSVPAQSAPSAELDRLTKLIEGQRQIAEAELTDEIEKKGGLFAWIFKPVLGFFKAQFSAVWTMFWSLFTSTLRSLSKASGRFARQTTLTHSWKALSATAGSTKMTRTLSFRFMRTRGRSAAWRRSCFK